MCSRPTWLAVLPVAALLIAGCGGGGGASSGTTSAAGTTGALSKAELIEQGDAICAKVSAAAATIKPDSPAASARLADLYSGMIKELKSLGNPDETEAKYGEYLNWAKILTEGENEVKLAAKQGDKAALEAASKTAESDLSTFELWADEYGFKDCGESLSSP